VKHSWRSCRDDFAEGRQCTRCGFFHYGYDDHGDVFWLPPAERACRWNPNLVRPAEPQ